MNQLNRMHSEGLTPEEIMSICKEIYPVGSLIKSHYNLEYTSMQEPMRWDGNPRKIWVTRGCGLCYDVTRSEKNVWHTPYYLL